MAIYHFSATPVQRSKGHSAVAGAAYRSGTEMLDRSTGIMHDYTRKRGIVQSEILTPSSAPGWTHDRAELWNRAEAAEKRKDGQPAREIRLALPAELNDEQRAELVFSFSRDAFVARGMIADISIHRPDRHGDARNHHAHIYLTMRELDGEQFGARKNRDWNATDTLEVWRAQWEAYANAALEDAGSAARIDHRSLEAQGIDREPTQHLGKDATAIEREGKASRIGEENRAAQERNRKRDGLHEAYDALEEEIAQEQGQEPEAGASIDHEDHDIGQHPGEYSPIVQQWLAEPELNPFNSAVTRMYLAEPAPTQEEEAEQARMRWYTELYSRAVETAQAYWTKLVERWNGYREGGRSDPEPER